MLNIKKWYAVYTRPKWEKKVHQLLQDKSIESYCPLNKVYRQWSDRKKIVLEPLFTSYVFVRLTRLECSLIKQVDGIINLVHWLGQPAVIKDEEIDAIKLFLDTHQTVQVEKINVSVNNTVKIIDGPFMDMEGKVVEVMHNTVKVVLPSLGYALTAPITRIAVLKEKSIIYKTA